MNIEVRNSILDQMKEMRRQLDRIEKALNGLDDASLDKIEDYTNFNVIMIEDLKDVFNFIIEDNSGTYLKKRGSICRIDLKGIFKYLDMEDSWKDYLKALKCAGVIDKGSNATIVIKEEGKSKRVYKVDMVKYKNYLEEEILKQR